LFLASVIIAVTVFSSNVVSAKAPKSGPPNGQNYCYGANKWYFLTAAKTMKDSAGWGVTGRTTAECNQLSAQADTNFYAVHPGATITVQSSILCHVICP
jgi:hypothetical protein